MDEYRYVSRSWFAPRLIGGHPDVLGVAGELGYDPLAFDEPKLRRRYFAGPRDVARS